MNLTDVEQAFALGDKDTLVKLQQAAEAFKGLERHPAYQEFVARLRESIHYLTEEVMAGVGEIPEKDLLSKAKFRDGIKFVLTLLDEKIDIWDQATRFIEELEKEDTASSEGNVMMPESVL